MDASKVSTESQDDQIITVKARKLTEKDLFYLEWGKEMVKNSFLLANDQLKHICSLCVALLSISVIFEKLFEDDPQLKFFAVLVFFVSIVVACIGINPFEKQIWLNSPGEIEKFQKQALLYKKSCYGIATVFLIMGIAIILISVVKQVYVYR